MSAIRKHTWLGALIGLFVGAALIMVTSPASAQLPKAATIDCIGVSLTDDTSIGIELRERTGPSTCGATVICSTGALTAFLGQLPGPPIVVRSQCSTDGPGVAIMSTLAGLLGPACAASGIGVTTFAGAGGGNSVLQAVAGPGAASPSFCMFVDVDDGGGPVSTNVNPGPPGTVAINGLTIANPQKAKDIVPALSAKGAVIFLLLTTGVFFLMRRRRSGMTEA